MPQVDWMYVALGLCLAVIFLQTFMLLRKKFRKAKLLAQDVSEREVPNLLTEPELACFNALNEVAFKEFHVMAKVSLSDIAIVKRGLDQAALAKAAKQGNRHIDFVLCDREHLAVVVAIELDDAKAKAARAKQQLSVSDLLEPVGISVFRLPVKTSYSTQEIRRLLTPYLKEKPPTPDEMVATISMQAFRICKKCQTKMDLKRVKSGKYKGMLFWVCGNYPECRSVDLFTR